MNTPLLIPGLVSITFRALKPEEIVERARRAGLRSIEWGADVHVPPDAPATARAVARLTAEAGLQVSSYGSYYKATLEPASFPAVLRTAVALGAPRIRVWAGPRDAAEADATERAAVADDVRRIARLSAAEGLRVALEFHANTLTSSAESAAELLQRLQGEAVDAYWQPRPGLDAAGNQSDLATLAPWLCHAHVFQWTPSYQRQPLSEGSAAWRVYLRQLAGLARPVQVQLEYVPDDDPSLLGREAGTLRGWLAELTP